MADKKPQPPAATAKAPTEGKKSRPERYGVSKVTRYKAPDGTMRVTWQAAVKHTNENALRDWLGAWLSPHVDHRGELDVSVDELADLLAACLRTEWNVYRMKL